MGFIPTEPTNFLSIRLTNAGRRMLSYGKLNFASAVVSDREIDYRFAVEEDYEHSCNRVLRTQDDGPALPYMNFDGTPPLSLDGNVYSDKKLITASTVCYGIFSASTATERAGTFSGYVLNNSFNLGSGTTSTNFVSGDSRVVTVGGMPAARGIVCFYDIRAWGLLDYSNPSNNIAVGYNALWYRYSAVTSQTIQLDRDPPYFSQVLGPNVEKTYQLLYLPWSGADSYYGTSTSGVSPVWNLNIVRTSTEIGTPEMGLKYRRYGSIEYAGTKRYLGFDMDTRMVGFVHYTNAGTGNTLGEQFIPKSTVIDLPLINWHRYSHYTDDAEVSSSIRGVRFSDAGSDIHYDGTAHTPYTLLKEDSFFGDLVVGRVYFKLKLIVLTDPELLTVLSYKSNRSWTLPPLEVSLVKEPKVPLTNATTSGMCESGKTFYVTYRTLSDQPSSPAHTHGYAPTMHCGYVQKIEGYTDENGLSYYLSAKFPPKSFPYMRNYLNLAISYGNGWNANQFQLLVAKVDTEDDLGLGYVPTNAWRALSDLSIGGNGAMISNPAFTIDPEELQNHQFIVSNEDYLSGSTYDLSEHYPDFFTRTDYNDPIEQLGLTYGNETLFPGVIQTVIAATVFKTTWKVALPNEQFNSSMNTTFDGTVNDSTYITEIGIFDDHNQLVGVAKPTWPIKKNYGRYLTFELEFDF